MPKYFCWALKYFWECFTTRRMRSMDTGRMTMATRVIRGLMVSIIRKTPTSMVAEEMSWVTL